MDRRYKSKFEGMGMSEHKQAVKMMLSAIKGELCEENPGLKESVFSRAQEVVASIKTIEDEQERRIAFVVTMLMLQLEAPE